MSAREVAVRILRFPSLGEEHEFDALATEPDVDCRWIERPEELAGADLVILPGSEATLADLAWMRAQGLEDGVRRAARDGAVLLGVCGGFQIMGVELRDPERIEKGAESAEGMGIFDLSTTFTRDLIDEPTTGTSRGGLLPAGTRVTGNELHGGRSVLRDAAGVTSLFDEETKGGASCPLAIATHDMAAIGTYLHGILADPGFRAALLARLRERRG